MTAPRCALLGALITAAACAPRGAPGPGFLVPPPRSIAPPSACDLPGDSTAAPDTLTVAAPGEIDPAHAPRRPPDTSRGGSGAEGRRAEMGRGGRRAGRAPGSGARRGQARGRRLKGRRRRRARRGVLSPTDPAHGIVGGGLGS